MAKTKKQVTLLDETISALEQEGMGSLSTGIELVYREWSRGGERAAVRPAKPKEKTLDLPDDDDPRTKYLNHPDNPGHRLDVAGRLLREANEREKAAQAERERPRREFQHRIEHAIETQEDIKRKVDQYRLEYADQLTEAEMKQIINAAMMNPDLLASRTRHMRDLEDARAELRREAELKAQGATEKEIQADWRRRHGMPDPEPIVQTLRLSVKALKGMGMFGTPEDLTDDQIRELNADWETRELPTEVGDEN